MRLEGHGLAKSSLPLSQDSRTAIEKLMAIARQTKRTNPAVESRASQGRRGRSSASTFIFVGAACFTRRYFRIVAMGDIFARFH